MKLLCSRSTLVAGLAISCTLLGSACEKRQEVKPGPPVLKMFRVYVAGGEFTDLLNPGDAGAPASFAPLTKGAGIYMAAIFDRLLDPVKLESCDGTAGGPKPPCADGGALTGIPGAVTASWPGMGAISINHIYDPGGDLKTDPPGPSLTLFPSPGVPSGAKVTFKLDNKVITSKKGEGFTGTDTFNIDTDPLEVKFNIPEPDPVTMMLKPQNGYFSVKATFNNTPGPNAGKNITVTDSTGKALAITAKPDSASSRDSLAIEMTRTDPEKPVEWPAGETLTVSIGMDADDLFGVKLGMPVTAPNNLLIKAAPIPDGGAGDGTMDGGGGDGPMDGSGEGSGG